ncbi:hypothetical protein ABT026_12330 [Streptomyces sp. NPDC002734]|uniref:hypothetical protein n=1 Tax=Streptomyces sp. NPDC002734 TaxID=3154426 RepID=UPI0033335179
MSTSRRITPRRLGVAAAVYGVFVAGWYLGQPVSPECQVDEAARDRLAEEYGQPEPSPTLTPTEMAPPSAHDPSSTTDSSLVAITIATYVLPCTNDMTKLPRLEKWLTGGTG